MQSIIRQASKQMVPVAQAHSCNKILANGALQLISRRNFASRREDKLMTRNDNLMPRNWDKLFMRDVSDLYRSMDRMFNSAVAPTIFRDWRTDFDTFFEDMRGDFMPAMDIIEKDDQIIIHLEASGIKKEDIKLNLDSSGMLTISGERKSELVDDKGARKRVERKYGTFVRSIQLPKGVDTKEVKAKFNNGVLEISIPKGKEETTSANINIE